MFLRRRRHTIRKRCVCIAKYYIITHLVLLLAVFVLHIWKHDRGIRNYIDYHFDRDSLVQLTLSDLQSNNTPAKLISWQRTLCSEAADRRGPHQKVIALSIYGTSSNFSNSPAFSWNASILPFLEPLANEVKLLLPSWIIRLYIDFTGSTESQRDLIKSFSNIDVCDMENIPFFGSLLLTYLPGKMWRFLPALDPYVDYALSRDLDSPMLPRERDTLDIWLSDEEKSHFFYVARDHFQHNMHIMGGLWGSANVHARDYLFEVFQPMLIPSIGSRYNGNDDQKFLADYVWPKVSNHTLAFDSFYCTKFGGRPFPSPREQRNFHLGCKRACCHAIKDGKDCEIVPACPAACRPKDHQDWEFC